MCTKYKIFKVLILVILCVAIQSVEVHAEALILDSLLTITEPVTYDSVRIMPTGQLVADSTVTVIGNMIIQPGGYVTHSKRNLYGLNLVVGDTLWIQRGTQIGQINVNGKGLRGGGRDGNNNRCGEVYDSDGYIVEGSCGSCGGSYGGRGGIGKEGGYRRVWSAYGLVEEANYLGSGGGCQHLPYDADGGNGGGLVKIIARILIVDGYILADGENGYAPNCYGYCEVGGGSGGGISIEADTLKGLTGYIGARGGNGTCSDGGGGGGGRIVIKADGYSEYTGTITTRGGYTLGSSGNRRNYASSGTIYIRDSRNDKGVAGSLILENYNRVADLHAPLLTELSEFNSITLRDGATFYISGDDVSSITINEGMVVQSNSVGKLLDGTVVTISRTDGPDLEIMEGSEFQALKGTEIHFDELRIAGGTFYTEIPIEFAAASDVELSSGSIVVRDTTVFRVPGFTEANIRGGTFDLGSDASLWVGNDSIRVGGGVTLVKDGRFGDGDTLTPDQITSMTILPGGNITHSGHYLPGLMLNVPGTLWIQRGASAGQINVSGRGLWGGGRGSNQTRCGETYDSEGEIVPGSCGGSGGSYGGLGGRHTSGDALAAAYGIVEEVSHLGGGGGCQYVPYTEPDGGNGGGLVRITAGTVIVDGEIRADGQTTSISNCVLAYTDVGGGSGGGISIEADTVRGDPAAYILARGGNGSCEAGGGGGGGRIVIKADDYSGFYGVMSARGGYNDEQKHTGSPGTIYYKRNDQTLGDLIIDNGNRLSIYFTPILTGLSAFNNVIVRSSGTLGIIEYDPPLLTDTLSVSSNGAVNFDGHIHIQEKLNVSEGGTLLRK